MNSLNIHNVTHVSIQNPRTCERTSGNGTFSTRRLHIHTTAGFFEITLFAADDDEVNLMTRDERVALVIANKPTPEAA